MSFKNNWIDKGGRVFIYFTVEEIMKRRNIHNALDDRLWRIQERMENEMKGMTVADVASDVKKEIDAE